LRYLAAAKSGDVAQRRFLQVGLQIPCPHCGLREFSEFGFGGEVRELASPDSERDFDRVYLNDNAPGPQLERWFHAYGCRRWFAITRDTVTNEILDSPGPA
jgi:heterotetrameric sarcosine oxidase delta subunit